MLKAKIEEDYIAKLKDGMVINEELGETLDSSVIVFNSKTELDIEPFDVVSLTDTKNSNSAFSHFLVDTIDDDIINPWQENEIHGYTLNLFSLTKLLEKQTLPNLAITQSKRGSSNKSVAYYIKTYLSLYSPKYREMVDASTNTSRIVNQFFARSEIDTKFLMTCPEFQWNNPTLREVLTDLMMVANCIPILKYSHRKSYGLSFIDLSENTGNQIDTTKLNRKKKSFVSADYCSELTLNMKNTLSKNTTKVVEYINFRNPDGGQVKDDDLKLETTYPIYEVKSLTAYYPKETEVPLNPGQTRNHYMSTDLTDDVLEESAWNILPNVNLFNLNDPNSKAWFIKFKRGGNIIDGFSYTYDPIFGITTPNIDRLCPNKPNFVKKRDIQFKIKYTTQTDRKMHIGKYLPESKHQIRNFDAQTSSYADPNRMSIFEYHKINRIGNKLIEIGGTYSSYSSIPELGDRIGKDILFKRSIEFRDGCYIFNGWLTKNYILQDYFTSVNAKQRSWEYVAGEDALTRYDVDKFYAELSFNDAKVSNNENIPSILGGNDKFGYFLLNNDLEYQVVVQCSSEEGETPDFPSNSNKGYALDTMKEVNGLSVLITYQFYDNYTAGKFNEKNSSNKYTDFYNYVDEDGRFESMNVYYVPTLPGTVTPWGDDKWVGTQGEPGSWSYISSGHWDNMSDAADTLPLIDLSSTTRGFEIENVRVFKDNSEIIRRSIQFEFCSDTEEIIIGDAFVKAPYIFTMQYATIKAFVSSVKPDVNDRNKLPSGATDITTRFDSADVDSNCLAIVFGEGTYDLYNDEYIYITNGSNEVLLALPGNRLLEHYIYYQGDVFKLFLNVMSLRDDNIYGNEVATLGKVVGNIKS